MANMCHYNNTPSAQTFRSISIIICIYVGAYISTSESEYRWL